MKVIIAGGRDFNDFVTLVKYCDKILINQENIIIVSGTAKGADLLGEKYAKLKGYKIKRFPANWDKFGKSAGMIRNAEMSKFADGAIIFWNGKSKGTKNMIDNSKKYNLKLRIWKY